MHVNTTLLILLHCYTFQPSRGHPQGVLIYFVFPLQQWLHKRASMLRHAYIACLVKTEVESVYCAVRPESLYKTETFHIEGLQ